MLFARFFLIALSGNIRNVVAAFPGAEIFLDHRKRVVVLHIAHQNNGRVLRPVVTTVELQAVIVLIRHVLDVFDKAHRGVRIGVALIRGRPQHFEKLFFRRGAVLVELAEHRLGFCLVAVLWIFQMLKPIGFQFQNLIEVVFGKDFVIDGAIVAGVSVVVRAGFLQNLVALVRVVMFAAAKHQMLEQVRVTALALFRFVARAGLHDDLQGHQVRIIRGHGDHPQTIWQIVNRVIVSESLARFLPKRQQRQAEN